MTDNMLMSDFAEFATNAGTASFPALARQRAVDAITDCLGCIIAGAGEPAAQNLRNITHLTQDGTGSGSLVWGGGYASPADAALCNGTAAHALDYDDTNHPAYAHPTAVLLPALMAATPHCNATGADLVTSYIVGHELIGKLGRALTTAHYRKGWHATSSIGAPAAALAVGRLIGLDPRQLLVALAIAGSSTGGLRTNFGTMIKPLHAGLAARAGVTAALLAGAGYDGAIDAFEHRFGYLSVFRGDEETCPDVLRTPGEGLEILTDFGLALKAFPSCGATHPGIEAAIRLHRRNHGRTAIARVTVGVSEMAFNPLIYSRPTTPLQAKFSMEFCIAASLTHGYVDLRTFSDQTLREAVLSGLIPKITMVADDRVRHDPEFATHVRVDYADGRTDEEFVPLAIGKPDRWMSEEMMRNKFEDCLRRSGQAAGAHTIFGALRQIDSASHPANLHAVLPDWRI